MNLSYRTMFCPRCPRIFLLLAKLEIKKSLFEHEGNQKNIISSSDDNRNYPVHPGQNYVLEHSVTTMSIDEGLDFITSHVEVPIWPRRLSTKLTEGRQILVHNNKSFVNYSSSNNDDNENDHDIWVCSYCGLRADRHFIKNHIPTCPKNKDKKEDNQNNKEDEGTTAK
jgi:hypothetical protein